MTCLTRRNRPNRKKGFNIHYPIPDTIVSARHCQRIRSLASFSLWRLTRMMKRAATLLLLFLVTSVAPAQERDVVVTGGWLFRHQQRPRPQSRHSHSRRQVPARRRRPVDRGGRTPSESRSPTPRRSFRACSTSTRTTRSSCSAPAERTRRSRTRRCFSRTASRRRSRPARWTRTSCATLRIRIENGVEPRTATPQLRPVLRHGASGLGSRHHRASRSTPTSTNGRSSARRAFKAKGITPDELRALIERAHFHGLTVTGHLDSGNRNSVNPRDAILMGIDRIEHFMGGDAFVADKSAYASYEHMTFDTPEFKRIAELYKQQHANFDATLSAYGYYGKKDPDVFTNISSTRRSSSRRTCARDRRASAAAGERAVREHLLDEAKGDQSLLRRRRRRSHHARHRSSELGRVLHAVLGRTASCSRSRASGIPNAAVLRIATINSARAMGLGDRLGLDRGGQVGGSRRRARQPARGHSTHAHPRVVIKAGRVYDPAALIKSVEGKIGPTSAADTAAWAPTPRPVAVVLPGSNSRRSLRRGTK